MSGPATTNPATDPYNTATWGTTTETGVCFGGFYVYTDADFDLLAGCRVVDGPVTITEAVTTLVGLDGIEIIRGTLTVQARAPITALESGPGAGFHRRCSRCR